jgi:hypothetical protein
VVDTDVTILTTRGVAGTKRRDSDVVERTEVTSDTANLLFEDLVVETGFELSLTGAGGGDVHGGLTTSDDNVVLDGCDGGRVEGCVGDVCLHDLERLGVHELREKVSRCLRQLKWRDNTFAVLSLEEVTK